MVNCGASFVPKTEADIGTCIDQELTNLKEDIKNIIKSTILKVLEDFWRLISEFITLLIKQIVQIIHGILKSIWLEFVGKGKSIPLITID